MASWTIWLAGEFTLAVLKFALAAELGWRMFVSLPGARATLASSLLFVTLVTLWAVLAAPTGAPAQVVAETALGPITHGTAWVFGALLAGTLYYRIPIHPLHRAILRAFVPYLLTFTVFLGLVNNYVWNADRLASYGKELAYLVVLAYWNVVFWRKSEAPRVAAQVMHTLQPWRKI